MVGAAHAGDLRISIPKRTKPTPVQKLNQEGVKAIQHHKLDKARQLFYKAYLLDPDDPFTLNNLGYISEMNGDIERAQRYYELAAENTSDATIDRSSLAEYKGKKVAEVAGHAADTQMQINRYNVQAMGLLMKGRASEADLVLEKALQLDPRNPFTLNNLGFAKEKQGEYEKAFTYYSKAANTSSDERIIVAVNKGWRGKRISEVARDNQKALSKLMEHEDDPEAKVARLNLEGVSAMNRNDHAAAREYFQRAYKIAPTDAFTLNNMGYLAEMDGDRETADFYYGKAQDARKNNAVAAVATRKDVEGKPIRAVAEYGGNMIATRMEAERAERARQGGPVLLKTRDGSPVVEPDKAPEPLPDDSGAPNPSEPLQPLPNNQQPPSTQGQPSGDVMPPLPDNAQPNSSAPANPGNVMPPLPDNQQPAANPGSVMPPLPDNQQPAAQPNNQAPQTQPPAAPKQGAVVDGVIQPLPETQQPDAAKKPTTPSKPKQ
jgi:Flp pilus assembly protein TadD